MQNNCIIYINLPTHIANLVSIERVSGVIANEI